MIWLVTFGCSQHHGSELLVGWQWFTRLRDAFPTQLRVISAATFDSSEFLDQESRQYFSFVDTRPKSVDEINSRHQTHVYRFWRGARAILKGQATAGDKLLIVSPAAPWFLPVISALPFERDDVLYGPMGAEIVVPDRWRLSHSVRNLTLLALGLLWRTLSRWLPGNVALRFPSEWFERILADKYRVTAVFPEVELHQGPERLLPSHPERNSVAVLYDARSRKNFDSSIDYAATVAAADAKRLVVLGAPVEMHDSLRQRAARTGAKFHPLPRMPRGQFIAWLRENRPDLVSLSLSEGVPSTLIEALSVGCELHVYDVGGVHWLVQFAAGHRTHVFGSKKVHCITWNQESHKKYQVCCDSGIRSLVAALRTAR